MRSMDKNLSSGLVLLLMVAVITLQPSVAKPNHLYRSSEDNVDFRLLSDSLGTAPDKTFESLFVLKSTFCDF